MLLVDTAGRVRDVSPDDRAETVSTPGGSGTRVLWLVGGGVGSPVELPPSSLIISPPLPLLCDFLSLVSLKQQSGLNLASLGKNFTITQISVHDVMPRYCL